MQAQLRNKKARLPQGTAKDRLLAAAESLFAESGVDGVSFRDLAQVAGVSLSSAHYYFTSKHDILAHVFNRRAKTMTDRRTALLDEALAHTPDRPELSEILRAFLQPAFEVTDGDHRNVFNRLLARLSVERNDANHAIVSNAFIENDLSFIDALVRAVPGVNRPNIYWRFHLMVGAMIYTMSDSGHLPRLSEGHSMTIDTDSALEALVDSFVAVFNAPATAFVPTPTPDVYAQFAGGTLPKTT